MNVVCRSWQDMITSNADFRLPGSLLRTLQDSLSVLDVELIPIHERLVTIRRQLVALAAKEGSHRAELKPITEELRKVDSLSTRPQILTVPQY